MEKEPFFTLEHHLQLQIFELNL
uniref:Uncharacterized protein n=1 Tax=Anguilla anguilla TaxID=7936 RepID=A0A0E9Q9V5_ANGAN